MSDFCVDPLGYAPVYDTVKGTKVGVVKFIIGILYLFMMFITIFWVKRNEKKARTTFHPDATNTVIFPPFVKILWLSALSNAFMGILMLTIPVEITGSDAHENISITVLLYPLAWALQHFVVEGIAFMLMQKGCGVGAATTAFRQALLWALVTFILQAGVYSSDHHTSIIIKLAWSSLPLAFFFILWLTPGKQLFRRPACFAYAKFWFWFRVISIFCYALSETKHLENYGNCGYVFLPLLGFALVQPFICYWTLLEDSLWWQGAFFSDFDNDDSPLFGIDLKISTAIALAEVMDEISSSKSAKLINFAHIHSDWRLIGQGSFSKVYKGSYRHVPCALKLIFTTDLTTDDIHKATVEAILLSSIRSRNIIHIYGICVHPPSVMIALELCELGSLFDVLRNTKLCLSGTDRNFLALGCCRGLYALHSFNDNIVHRDIKSMNFLVDRNLNAKLCDLELGQTEATSKKVRSENETENFLLNWMPPEYIQFKQYTRPSDVYALSLVLWEIWSKQIPYEELSQQEISRRVGWEGYRPALPTSCSPAFCQLLTMGWAQDQTARLSASDMVAAVGSIWRDSFFSRHFVVETSRDFSATLDKFLRSSSAETLAKYISSYNRARPTESSQAGINLVEMVESQNPLQSRVKAADSAELTQLRGLLQAELELSKANDKKQKCLKYGWAQLETLTDAVLIVSLNSPYFILGASEGMRKLLNVSPRLMVGFTLDYFVRTDSEEDHSTGLSHTGNLLPHYSPERNTLLKMFYRDMVRPERAHVVLDLHLDDDFVTASVSSFPIYSFQCDLHSDPDSIEENFLSFRDSIPEVDTSAVSTTTNTGANIAHSGDMLHERDRNQPEIRYCGLLFSRLVVDEIRKPLFVSNMPRAITL